MKVDTISWVLGAEHGVLCSPGWSPSSVCFLFVFWTLFKGFAYFFFKTSIIFIKLVLRAFSCASTMLEYSGLAVVG